MLRWRKEHTHYLNVAKDNCETNQEVYKIYFVQGIEMVSKSSICIVRNIHGITQTLTHKHTNF